MRSLRQERVNSLLQEELSGLLARELQDPALEMVTFTGVEVAPDLRTARVYASVLGEEPAVAAALAALHKYRKFLQRRLGEDLTLRYTPRLNFIADRTAARAQRIETLLARIASEPPLPDEEDSEAEDGSAEE